MIPESGYEADGGWMEFDSRARILALFFFVVAVCAASGTGVLAGLFTLGLLLTVPAGLRPGATFGRLLPVNLFMLLIWLTMPFLAAGPRVPVAGPIAVSAAGVQQALAITLKANAIVLATSAILNPVELGSLALGMRGLGAPVKIVWLFILSHRYAFGLADRVSRSVLAIRLRSGRGKRMRFQAYGGLLAKLFVVGHQSGERLHMAMLARGYGERFALHREITWRPRDTLLAACAIALAAAAIIMDATT